MSPVLCWIETRKFELQLLSALGMPPVWLRGGALEWREHERAGRGDGSLCGGPVLREG